MDTIVVEDKKIQSQLFSQHLQYKLNFTEKRADSISENQKYVNALIDGDWEVLTEIKGITEEPAQAMVEAYGAEPYTSVNHVVLKTLTEICEQEGVKISKSKIYTIAQKLRGKNALWTPDWRIYSVALSGDITLKEAEMLYPHLSKKDAQYQKYTQRYYANMVQVIRAESQNTIVTPTLFKLKESDDEQEYPDALGVINLSGQNYIYRKQTIRDLRYVFEYLWNRKDERNPLYDRVDLTDDKTKYLYPDQLEAVEQLKQYSAVFFTGYGGTGKTFTLSTYVNSILPATDPLEEEESMYEGKGVPKVYGTALSNKAVLNLRQSMYLDKGIIFNTSSISGVENVDKYAKQVKQADLLLIDEISMAGLSDLAHVLHHVSDNTQIIMIGDVRQLPAINLDILNRLIDSDLLNTVRLTIPKRQTADSEIYKDSMKILNHELPNLTSVGDSVKVQKDNLTKPETLYNIVLNHLNTDLFIVPTNDMVDTINETMFQETLSHNRETTVKFSGGREMLLKENERVINTKNIPDLGIYNNDFGTVTYNSMSGWGIEFDNGRIYTLDEIARNTLGLNLGYASTVHKAQGSTIDDVVTILPNEGFINNNLIYTAITRAKRHHTLYYETLEGLQYMINQQATYQYVDLSYFPND